MEENKIYSFKDLEKFLNEWENRNKFLKLNNISQKCTAIMHIFSENFCGDWLSGDGILFYSDGEVHSANPDDEFLLIEVVEF